MKVLIANRGEIAVRVIRALKKLGYESVAIYTKADEESLHVKLADTAICIGNEKQSQAYLDKLKIFTVAVELGVDAIHPGYGFFSEDSHFVKMCEDLNIVFLGPASGVIELMGDKINAIETVQQYGLPILPSSDGPIKNIEELPILAKEIGYPIIIKAAGGGGGKGLRIVHHEDDLIDSYNTVLKEVPHSADRVFVEKYLSHAKHVEIQILADSYGNAIHLGTRDCSIQRNNQKVIEEAPAIVESDKVESLLEACKTVATELNYVGAGTFEFLYQDGEFYFLEMNTRVQVEHPISEMITNFDLVSHQIEVGLGKRLETKQEDIEFTGHSIEVRINAEDGLNHFMPTPGRIKSLNLPGGANVRNDFGIYSKSMISPHYDSMFGKIIVHGENRDEALINLNLALEEFNVEGLKTTKELAQLIINHPEFLTSTYQTNFIKNNYESLISESREEK